MVSLGRHAHFPQCGWKGTVLAGHRLGRGPKGLKVASMPLCAASLNPTRGKWLKEERRCSEACSHDTGSLLWLVSMRGQVVSPLGAHMGIRMSVLAVGYSAQCRPLVGA